MSEVQNQENGVDWSELSDEEYAREVIRSWGKPIPEEWDQDKLTFFKAIEHRSTIESLARGLTMEETLNYFGLVLDVLPEYDALYFVSTFLKGRVKGKSDAVENLFATMRSGQGNAGVSAAAMYLTQFADSFSEGKSFDKGLKGIKIEIIE